MPPLHIKRGDAPLLGRVREFFRKKRTIEGDAHDVQENWKKDRDDLIKEIEKMLENQRAFGNLASPSQLHTADTYCSASTQTEMPEELFTPAKLEFEDMTKEKPKYTSSSTQIDLEVAEEKSSANFTQVASSSPPPRSPTPPLNGSGISHEVFRVSKEANDTFVPDDKRPYGSIGKTGSSQSSSSQNISSYPPRLTADNGMVRHQRHSIDDETGAIRLWKTSRVPWKNGKVIVVRFPPQSFGGNMLHRSWRTPSADVVADDIKGMEQMLWELEHEADWVTTDEEDKEDYGSDVKSSTGIMSFNPYFKKGAKFS